MARAAVKRVAQAEIRAAKSFLERRGLDSDDVSPRKFAMAAKELDKGAWAVLLLAPHVRFRPPTAGSDPGLRRRHSQSGTDFRPGHGSPALETSLW